MIQWYNVVAIIAILLLSFLTVKDHSNGYHGGYFGDLSILINIFWFLITMIFVILWGGIFWW